MVDSRFDAQVMPNYSLGAIHKQIRPTEIDI